MTSKALLNQHRGAMSAIAALIIILMLATAPSAFSGTINNGFIISSLNQTSDIVLSTVPINITEPGGTIEIDWTPAVRGVLNYTVGIVSGTTANFDQLTNPLTSTPGFLEIDHDQLPIGILTCYISSTQGNSAPFQLIIAADQAPNTIYPITEAGGSGINTVTPEFNWNPIAGVPYYHVILADQPFEIIDDNQGVRVEGANIIWQAITQETSIQYGVDDPSGYFNQFMIPPMVGAEQSGNRPRYSWLVLNNYGNHPAFTSTVVGGVSGFEVEIEAPFDPPVINQPDHGSLQLGDEILLQWSDVSEANSYFVYLSRLEVTAGGSEANIGIWQTQTTTNAAICPASSLLENGIYYWKVLAADDQGLGAVSDTSSFVYDIASGEVVIRTRTTDNDVLAGCNVEFIVIDGPFINDILTNDNGNYRRDFPVGTYRIRVSKNGYVDTESSNFTVTEGNLRNVIVQLPVAPANIIGVVQDDLGNNISGATITASHATHDDVEAASNLSGQFNLPVATGVWTINVEKSGYANATPRVVTISSNGQIVDLANNGGPIILNQFNMMLNGHVVNHLGEPINLAEVSVTNDSETFTTFTNQAGSFSFTLGNDTWGLSAFKAGFYLDSGPLPVIISGQNETQDIILIPQAAIVTGHITIDGSLGGNSDVIIRATPSSGEPVEVNTWDNGEYSLGLSPGNYSIRAVLQGYTGTSVSLSLSAGQSQDNVNLYLNANPSSISGIVSSLQGNRIANATVQLGSETVLTNSVGTYTITAPAGNHMISASAPSYGTVNSGPWSLAPGQALSGVNFQLSPNAASVTGRVSYGNSGIVGATVTATVNSSQQTITATTVTGGNFSFSLPPNEYTLTVSADGFSVLSPVSYALNLAPGATVNNRNFALQPYIAYISGVVANNGSPLGSANITLTSLSNGEQNTTNTNVQGNFNISVTPEAAYSVLIEKAGYQSYTTETSNLTVGQNYEIEASLSASGASVSGRVLSSGTGLSGATIIAENSQNTYSVQSNSQGNYVISLQPGSYSISVTAPGYDETTGNINPQPGATRTNVNWTLEDNFAAIAGRITDESGTGINGANVTVTRNGTTDFNTVTDNLGFYTHSSLLGGNYTLEVSADGYVSDSDNLGLIIDGQSVSDRNYSLEALTSGFTGTVTSNAGSVANATVRATAEDGSNWTTLSSTNGSYTLSPIPAGTYDLIALKSGFSGITVTDQSLDIGQTLNVALSVEENNGVISGTVRNSSGVGLSNVAISASADPNYYGSVTSDVSGNFSLTGLYPNVNYTLYFTKSGYEPETLSDVSTGSSNISINMLPNALALSGTLRNQAGTGMGGIQIRVSSLSDGTTYDVQSSTGGTFSFNSLARNTNYRVQSLYNESGFLDADTTIQILESNVTSFNPVIIQRNAEISGTVGIGGVSLRAQRSTGGIRNIYSATDGTFRFEELREGDWTITPTKSGYVFSPANQLVGSLEVGGTVSGVDFDATSTEINISGRLTDETNTSLSGWRIRLLRGSNVLVDSTDETGAFSFEDVPGFSSYHVSVSPPASYWVTTDSVFETTSSDVSNINLQAIAQAGYVTGNVTSSDNNQPIISFILEMDGESLGEIRNSAGIYSIENLRRGNHELVISAAQFDGESTSFTFDTGLDTTTINFSLDPLLNALSFRVSKRINDETSLMTGAQIDLSDGTNVTTLYTSDGLATFTDLSSDLTYSATIHKAGFNSIVLNDLIPGADAYLRTLLPSSGMVLGTLYNTDGTIHSGGQVLIRTISGERRTTTADSYGHYALSGFVESMILIGIGSDGQSTSYARNISLSSSDYVYKNLTISNTAKISGSITSNGSAPASRAVLSFTNSTASQYIFALANADGTYSIRGLRPGTCSLELAASGYEIVSPSSPTSLVLEAGESETINWSLIPEFTSLVGSVSIEGSDPLEELSDVSVIAVGDVETYESATDANGNFAFVDILEGDYNVTFSKLGYETLSDQATTVLAGNVVSLDVSLSLQQDVAFGRVIDQSSGEPVEEALSFLENGNGDRITQETNSSGYFIYENLQEDSYSLWIRGSRIPATYSFEHIAGETHADLDFQLVTSGTARITGGVIYQGSALRSIPVSIRKYGSATLIDGFVGSDGRYTNIVDAPGTYQVIVDLPEYGYAESQVFDVEADDQIRVDVEYASGQININLTDVAANPVTSHNIQIVNDDGSVSLLLTTDSQGNALTEANLQDGDYTVTAEPREGTLPANPINVTIANGASVEVDLTVGIDYSPVTSSNAGSDIVVELTIPETFTLVDSSLYYRNVNESFFRETIMERVVGGASLSGGLNQNREARAPRTANEMFGRSRGRSRNIVSTDILNDVITYRGTIPAQSLSGTLAYYPYLVTDNGQIFGGESAVQEVTVSRIGYLDNIRLTTTSPSAINEAIPGVPILLEIRVFDEASTNLTQSIAQADGFTWSANISSPEQIEDSKNKAVYTATSDDAIDTVTVNINQPSTGATLVGKITIPNVYREVDNIEITLEDDKVGTESSIQLTATAKDSSNIIMSFLPNWTLDSGSLCSIESQEFTTQATLTGLERHIGVQKIIVEDEATGVQAEAEVKVYHKINSGPNASKIIYDGGDMSLRIAFNEDAADDESGDYYLTPTKLRPLLKSDNVTESLYDKGYSLVMSGTLNESNIEYTLGFDLSSVYFNRNPRISYWNSADLKWVDIESELNADSTKIQAVFNGGDLSISKMFTVMVDSKPLGIEGLHFNPNPFSPEGQYPLSIEFTVNSNKVYQPLVTIEIFNMVGQHVRTLIDRQPLGKGYQHTRDKDPVIWDGLTDSGRKARNGRYVVRIEVEDFEGEKVEKIDTVVLIK